MMPSFRAWGLALLVLLTAAAAVSAEEMGRSEAVILMYHRFGEDDKSSTNIRLEQFDAHIAELTGGGYHVLPLAEIVAALRNGEPLPHQSIAITIDDAFASVYREAWPRLRAAGLPFTLFVAPQAVDDGTHGYMSWDQIRELAENGVTIGHHAHSHDSLNDLGMDAAVADIAKASARFTAELGGIPKLFAYPYGEFSTALTQAVRELGFDAAFGQHSGVASAHEPLYGLPRFALNEAHSGLDRFRLVARARALPVAGVVPEDPFLGTNPPSFGFTLTEKIRGLSALACYPSHLGQAAEVQVLGGNRIEVRFDKPFPRGRSRINCTMPGPQGRWYWFGRPFFVPRR